MGRNSQRKRSARQTIPRKLRRPRNAGVGRLARRIAQDCRAGAGLYRLVWVDLWNPPGDHVVLGRDFPTHLTAAAEARRLTDPNDKWSAIYLYNDRGELLAEFGAGKPDPVWCECALRDCPHHRNPCPRQATTLADTHPEQRLCRWCLDALRLSKPGEGITAAHLRDLSPQPKRR